MRNLVFFLIFNFIWIQGNIKSRRQGFLSSFTFEVKCLDCTINLLLHTFSGGALVSSTLLPFVCVKWRVFLRQQVQSSCNLPGNFKGVAGFKRQTELYPNKYRSKSAKSWTFIFNCLSKSNIKVLTICLGLWYLC